MTVQLRTGEVHPSRPEHYITKQTAVAPAPKGTPHPLFDAFLNTVTDERQELIDYLWRVFGYFLTGQVKEHALFFFYGTGANGKTVLINTLIGILKDYAATISTDMLMVSKTDRHPTEIARLRGIRLAVGSEIENGRTWAESKIKALTGGDRLQGRFMRQDFFEFQPQFKLLVVGNNKPSLRGVDEAIRRRLHLVPFTVTIPEEKRDPDLPEKLKHEWPAILRSMIGGSLKWQRQGLNPPKIVLEATDEYLDAEDAIAVWIDECATRDPNAWEQSTDLYRSWKRWAEASGEFVGSKKRFSRELVKHGFEQRRKMDGRGYIGLKLNSEEVPGRWDE